LDMLSALTPLFQAAVAKAFSEHAAIDPEITRATDEKFGDYQVNLAMKLARQVGQPPRKVAEMLLAELPQNNIIETCDIAGPGFINIRVKNQALQERMQQISRDPALGCVTPQRQKIVVDFSSPNVAKEMHVGHLRSTIIGDSIARIFEFLGHDVLRLNHIGDWGTAFGMLIAYLRQQPQLLSRLAELSPNELLVCYRTAKQLFDSDEDFRRRAQLAVVELQSGEAQCREIWQQLCAISRSDYQQLYQQLDIEITERGESFYQDQLAQIVEEFQQQGLVSVSDGARCIFLEGFLNREGSPLPLMIQKSDGGYNYDTTDLAALKQRIFEEHADRIIIVTDAGQSLHFTMLEAAARQAGWFDHHTVRFDHVPFGLVLGSDGKKFRTRSGETVSLRSLLQEAIEQATQIVRTRNIDWSEDDIQETGRCLGISAVKYADLSCHRVKDYVFSLERMLRFDGNTAPFILYSLVRARSILRKLGTAAHRERLSAGEAIDIVHSSERALIMQLLRFPEVLAAVTEELLPHRLAEYLYELAERFNHFFRDCRVEGTPEQASRLKMVAVTETAMATGLSLLGIASLERM